MSFNLIDKNYNAETGSFLYYLHEKDSFNIEEFVKLCEYIDKLPFKSEETKGFSEKCGGCNYPRKAF